MSGLPTSRGYTEYNILNYFFNRITKADIRILAKIIELHQLAQQYLSTFDYNNSIEKIA